MTKDFILYFSFLTSALTIAFTIYYLILRKKTSVKYSENNKAEIIGQRKRLEDRIYELEHIMLSDPDRLFDNTKLLLEFPDKDLTISNTVPNYTFFYNMGIDLKNISIKDKTIFCLTPFHKNFDKLYKCINTTCTNNGYECFRSDNQVQPGKVLQQIIKMMFESQLIIAVLDGKNPNVFYEIGIAHSIGKTVILIANLSKVSEIPFDLKSDRLLLYSNMKDLDMKLSNVLKNIHYAD